MRRMLLIAMSLLILILSLGTASGLLRLSMCGYSLMGAEGQAGRLILFILGLGGLVAAWRWRDGS